MKTFDPSLVRTKGAERPEPIKLSFFIPGEPKSTQTGSVVRAGDRAFPVRRNTPWSAVCGMVARTHAPKELLDGPLRVTLQFWMPKPKAAKRRDEPIVRPDLENLCKGLLDSWNGVLWKDDSQVVDLRLIKAYSALPGIDVLVEWP